MSITLVRLLRVSVGRGGRSVRGRFAQKIGVLRWSLLYTPDSYPRIMPKGIKTNSSQIIISTEVVESAPNTFTQAEVDLQLNVLDREVFVVTAVDLDVGSPNAVAATDTSMQMSLSTTSRTTIGDLSDTNVLATALSQIRAGGFIDGGVGFMQQHPEAPTGNQLDYIGLIATNDFFLQYIGANNVAAGRGQARIWGYRGIADANTFAALTQSELLSA